MDAIITVKELARQFREVYKDKVKRQTKRFSGTVRDLNIPKELMEKIEKDLAPLVKKEGRIEYDFDAYETDFHEIASDTEAEPVWIVGHQVVTISTSCDCLEIFPPQYRVAIIEGEEAHGDYSAEAVLDMTFKKKAKQEELY